MNGERYARLTVIKIVETFQKKQISQVIRGNITYVKGVSYLSIYNDLSYICPCKVSIKAHEPKTDLKTSEGWDRIATCSRPAWI